MSDLLIDPHNNAIHPGLRGELSSASVSPIGQHPRRRRDDGMTVDLPAPGAQFRKDPGNFYASPVNEDTVEDIPREASIGRVLRNRYVIESRLGSGGMGTVFKARDRFRCDLPEDEQYVAIKLLHLGIPGRSDILSRLRREFYCAQALSHRNIVRVYELDHDRDIAFFTMELLSGTTLRQLMEQAHPAPLARDAAWSIISDVGSALVYAHGRRVVHADLKPQNIMVTQAGAGCACLVDFGTSSKPEPRRSGADDTQTMSLTALTPTYASCELLEGETADAADDLYALACVSYELLAGVHPFQTRRSTEARALGMRPKRPTALTDKQWQTLQSGLAWQRQDRAIPVAEWIARLLPEPTTMALVTPAPDVPTFSATHLDTFTDLVPVLPVPPPPRYGWSSTRRTYGILLGLLVALGVAWGIAHRSGSGQERVPVSEPEVGAPEDALSTDTPQRLSTSQAESQAASQVTSQVVEPQIVESPIAETQSASPAAVPTVKAAAPKSPRTSVLVRTQSPSKPGASPVRGGVRPTPAALHAYVLQHSQNFVEIRVAVPATRTARTFDWWTEAGTARAGIDYVAQSRAPRVAAAGQRQMTLFVKLLDNHERTTPRVFYVVIDGTTRTAIRLPALHTTR